MSWTGTATAGDQIQFWSSQTNNGISPTILIRKIPGGTIVEQTNISYVNPPTNNNPGRFNLYPTDSTAAITIINATDPD